MEEKLVWEAHEYLHRERSKEWFFTVYIISAACVVVAVIFQNYLFAVLLAIAAFTLILYAKRTPRLVRYELSHAGIRQDSAFFPFSNLEGFYIDMAVPEVPKLLVQSKKLIMPLLVIPVEGINPDELRTFLSHYLSETELSEPLSQKIMEYLGF